MQSHNSFVVVTTIAVALTASFQLAEDAFAEHSLSIAISTPVRVENALDHRVLPVREGQHFHVLITNDSDKDQKLWESWNSWGFFNLRFDILDEKGEVINSIVKTPDTVWTRNFPSYTVLKPRQHLVFDVGLSHRDWVIARKRRPYTPFVQTEDATNKNKLNLQAVFEIPKDEETDKQFVWVGQIQTAPETYEIRAK